MHLYLSLDVLDNLVEINLHNPLVQLMYEWYRHTKHKIGVTVFVFE